MLDALKVLFILTGASTYLVTKYVNVGLGAKNDTTMTSSLSGESLSPEMRQLLDKYRTKSVRVSNSDGNYDNHHNNNGASESGGTFNINNGEVNGLSKNHRTKPSLDTINDNAITIKSANKTSQLSSVENNDSDNNDNTFIEYVKPTYVIKLIEEDDKSLPKLLLQVSASSSSPLIFKRQKSIYFLSESSRDINDNFIVNSTTGELFVLKPLDRDPPLGRSEWSMTVLAKHEDNSQPFGFADVVIHLTDINDNHPIFTRDVFVTNISESANHKQSIITVTALDNDDPDSDDGNGRIFYSIRYNNGSSVKMFIINGETGVISLAPSSVLNRESESQHVIQVMATDGGSLSSSATVIINVIDVNDSPPRFYHKNLTVELMNDHNLDEPIAILSVEDDDLLESNYFDCQLMSDISDDGSLGRFYVMTNLDGSCSLFASKLVNASDATMKNLTVCVSDNGPNINYLDTDENDHHSDCCTVIVTIVSVISNQTFLRRHFEVDPCLTITCFNNGNCVPMINNNYGFKCECPDGFSGLFCDVNSSHEDKVVIRLGNPAIIAILICLINALILLLIIVIYTQTKSQIRAQISPKIDSKTSTNDDDHLNTIKMSSENQRIDIEKNDNLNSLELQTKHVTVSVHHTPPPLVTKKECHKSQNCVDCLCDNCSNCPSSSSCTEMGLQTNTMQQQSNVSFCRHCLSSVGTHVNCVGELKDIIERNYQRSMISQSPIKGRITTV